MTDGATAVVVNGHDETADTSIELDRWCEVAHSTLALEGIRAGRLDLIFVDAEDMAVLNQQHLGHEGPTDVLAFPIDGPTVAPCAVDGAAPVERSRGHGEPVVGDPALHLGDVVVCPGVALEQAPAHTGSDEAELTLLVVHGLLHVLGHDHAEAAETARMQGRERLHLQRYGYDHPEAV